MAIEKIYSTGLNYELLISLQENQQEIFSSQVEYPYDDVPSENLIIYKNELMNDSSDLLLSIENLDINERISLSRKLMTIKIIIDHINIVLQNREYNL